MKKNGQRRYKYLVLGRDKFYFFIKNYTDSTKRSLTLISSKCSNYVLTTYWLCLVNVFCIPMDTNCVLPLTDLFLYSHEAYFIQGLHKKNEKKLARSKISRSTNHDLHLELDCESRLRTQLYEKRLFEFSHCELFINMEHLSLSWYDIPELVVHIRISLIKDCC